MRPHHAFQDTAPSAAGFGHLLHQPAAFVLLVSLISGGLAAHTGGAVPLNSTCVSITSLKSDPDQWSDQFLEYLQRLNDQLGGSAPLTSTSIKEAMAEVQTTFESQGLPTPLTTDQVNETLNLISSLEDMLKDAPAGTDTQYLSSVLEELRDAYQDS